MMILFFIEPNLKLSFKMFFLLVNFWLVMLFPYECNLFLYTYQAPTWAAWNIVMLALALSLGALLCIALGSSSMALLGHVFLLMSLAGVLFALLSW